MITDKEIEQKAEALSLHPNDVEKDYVHSWVLNAIFSRPALAHHLVLKGGNALRKAYFQDTRFSKDLDFSSIEHIDEAMLETELREVCKIVENQTDVKFLDKTIIKDKNLPFDVDALEVRLYFKGFYNEEKIDLKTQLDVTQFDKIYLPIQSRKIIHPYSDAGACNGMIRCQKAEEILASKLTTLLHRRKAGDLFDLLYGILVGGGHEITRREVISTFLKKSIFEPRPDTARSELLSVPLDDYAASWSGILVPSSAFLSFDFVTQNFASLINSLFDLVASPVRSVTAGGSGRLGRSFGRASSRLSTFSGNFRNIIINGGRSQRMIELTYQGYRRFVEPYKLEYYVRKKDGVGNEYFWGYDTTGGKSGKQSIKQFFCDQIQSVRSTEQRFNPRYEIEL